MKVIDLLNKIANGEEVPKIKYDKHILKYNKDEKRFIDENRLNSFYEIDFSELNDEVEIIEEEKKITPTDFENLGYALGSIQKYINKGYDKAIEENKIPEKIKDKYCSQISKVELAHKINGIIDYLESEVN